MRRITPVTDSRREFLKLVGAGAVVLPIAGLGACAKKESAPAASAPVAGTAPEPAAAAAAAETAPAPAVDSAAPVAQPVGPLPRLEESDPVAVALGYRHDSVQVDVARYPTHAAGRICANCVQYRGAAGEPWGGCGLFPGKSVNANGWCSGYAAKT